MIQTVIFDVGGVLKTETDSAIQRDIMETLDISLEVFAKPWKILTEQLSKGEIPEDEFWQQMLKMTGSQNKLPNESLLLREYQKAYHPNKDVLEIVARLRSAQYPTAILSNTIARHADFNRAQGLYDGFGTVILSHEVGLLKPGSEIFDLALATLEVAPEETAFIDDNTMNVLRAEDMGIQSILFTNARQLEERLKELDLTF